MLNQLFSPNGRIGSADFMRFAVIFIVIGFLADFFSIYNTSSFLGLLLGLVDIVFIYLWVVLWIKRYHDAGKEGTFAMIPIAIYILAIVTLSLIILWPNILAIMEADEASTNAAAESLRVEMRHSKGFIMLVVNAGISFAIAYFLNKQIAHDPNDNKFGPAT